MLAWRWRSVDVKSFDRVVWECRPIKLVGGKMGVPWIEPALLGTHRFWKVGAEIVESDTVSVSKIPGYEVAAETTCLRDRSSVRFFPPSSLV